VSRKPRCRSCGRVLTGPIRGGRVFCSPACWPSRPQPDSELSGLERLEARRAETAARIERAVERGESSIIDELVLRRLDAELSEKERPMQNGKPSESVIDQLAKRGRLAKRNEEEE
jgi:uncharacterized Zn finger protein (UPF0148 family)